MKHDLIRENLSKVYELFKGAKFQVDLNADPIKISSGSKITKEQESAILATVQSMQTWRKGPYKLFDLNIDSEWLGEIKWQRIKSYLPDLTGKLVADIGASNGYYSFKLLTEDPAHVYAFDPFQICKYQFDLINFFIKDPRLEFLLKGIEDLIHLPDSYDFMLYMGVLYHRKDPVASLKLIYDTLKPAGQVLTETLILPGDQNEVVEITDRYSKMKNVYYLSTLSGLVAWLEEAGFKENRIISVSQTSVEEQRISPFAPFQSLAEFLDPDNFDLTVEGLPAPRRAIVLSTK